MDDDLNYFYEDATEQLQYMENALLDAKDGTSDPEIIAEIFRAMHTMKGNAGMFCFDDIVSLSHKAESLLDEIREGNVVFTSQLSVLFMNVKDSTFALVENKVNGIEIEEEIKNSLEYLENELLRNMPNLSLQTEDIEKNTEEEQSDKLWHISIRFEPEFLRSGMDILSILKYFLKQGEILLNIPITDAIPLFDDFDPVYTYMGFEIDFQSQCTEDDIIEIFEFVEDDIDLIVFEHNNEEMFQNLFDLREDTLKQILIDNFSYEEKNQEEIGEEKNQENISEVISVPDRIVPTIQESIRENPTITNDLIIDNGFFLKVNSLKIDNLINKVSEIVIKNAQIEKYSENKDDEILEDMLTSMATLLEEVRDGVMNIRMVQVKDSFSKYRRIVNDTALKLDKQIDFILKGENTELDKSVVEKLNDPFTHMIRNSLDHGIEKPQVRISKGKNPRGKIMLSAYPDAGTIVIELEDDGAGINKEAILRKAILNGVIDKEAQLTDKEIYQLIFSAGLSTSETISDLSGRGVGMDVVRKNIEDLRGVIEVDSVEGKGSKITIRLPLTLAIIDGFLVQSGHNKFIIPVETISQCIELTDEYMSEIKGVNTINVRGKVLPLLNLRKFYNDKITPNELDRDEDEDEYRQNVVIVRYSSYEVGLLVDELYGQQQVVIKSLGEIFEKVPGISGGSILGNGEIALILDIPKLIENQIIKGN